MSPAFQYPSAPPPGDSDSASDLAVSETAFRAVAQRLRPRALRLACRKFAADDAEDLVQESLVQLWAQAFLDKPVPREPVDALFFCILARRMVDSRRSGKRLDARDADLEHIQLVSAALEAQTDTRLVAEGSLLLSRIRYVIGAMPDTTRLVFLEALKQRLDARATATSLDMNYNTVRWHINDGKQRLRKALRRDGYDLPDESGDQPAPRSTP